MSKVTAAVVKNTRNLVLENKGASTVMTQGNIVDLTAGLAVDASSSSTRDTIRGVCNQTIAAAEALTQVPVIVPGEDDTFVVDSTNNSDEDHNGQAMIVGADPHTINNTGTTSAAGVVVQVGVFGATGDKKIVVRFIK
jgi:hypothetical protein